MMAAWPIATGIAQVCASHVPSELGVASLYFVTMTSSALTTTGKHLSGFLNRKLLFSPAELSLCIS